MRLSRNSKTLQKRPPGVLPASQDLPFVIEPRVVPSTTTYAPVTMKLYLLKSCSMDLSVPAKPESNSMKACGLCRHAQVHRARFQQVQLHRHRSVCRCRGHDARLDDEWQVLGSGQDAWRTLLQRLRVSRQPHCAGARLSGPRLRERRRTAISLGPRGADLVTTEKQSSTREGTMTDVRTYQYFSNGKWLDAEGRAAFDVIEPYSRKVMARAPNCGANEVRKATQAAHQAFPGWADT